MLNPGAGAPIETGLSMAMAAGGGRGQILGGGEGFGLAFKADTLMGRNADEGRERTGRQPRLNHRGSEPAAHRARGLTEHDDRETHGPDAERRDRDTPGRR